MASRVKAWLLLRWPAALSAGLLLLAFPPFDVWPLVFFALVPLFYRLRTTSSKEAWKVGYLFGLVFFLGQFFWLDRLAVHWTQSELLGLIPWVLASLYAALFAGWVSVLIRQCYVRNWVWLIPIVWAGIEVCRSYFPVLAMPWGLAATPLYQAPLLIQTAHFGTIYLVSCFVILANVMVVCVVDPKARVQAAIMLAVLCMVCAISGMQYVDQVPAETFPITIGQPAVDMAFGDLDTRPAKVGRIVDGFTEEAIKNGSRLMILPEGIVEGISYPPKPSFLIDRRLPVLFGGQHGHGDTVYQSAFSFDGSWHSADKTRLMIFGEFVPGRDTFPFIAKAFKLANQDLSASKNGVRSVEVAGIKVGPMLCFEGLFPDISYQQARNGSKLIAVMCIDDWYMGTTAPEQLMAGSIFRAVETGLPVARSASLGYTIAVDARGRIIGRLPLKESKTLQLDIQLPKYSTLFPLVPVFPVAALLVALTLPWWKGSVSPKVKQNTLGK